MEEIKSAGGVQIPDEIEIKNTGQTLESQGALDGKSFFREGQKFELGLEGVEKDIKEAAELYRLAAEQNEASAQARLSYLYAHGLGVERDEKEALRLYKLAAEQGNADGQVMLAQSYEHGWIVERDRKAAIGLYKLAAEKGQVSAQKRLADYYETGRGVEKDCKEAAKWYRLAAEQGDNSSQLKMGSLYDEGLGVEQDREQAAKWYRLAAAQGVPAARRWLVNYHEEEALKLRELMWEHSDSFSGTKLGEHYLLGDRVEKDEKKAASWYQRSAAQGHAEGQYDLARCYWEGIGRGKDSKEASRLCHLSANQGCWNAQAKLIEECLLGTKDSDPVEDGKKARGLSMLWHFPLSRTESTKNAEAEKVWDIFLDFWKGGQVGKRPDQEEFFLSTSSLRVDPMMKSLREVFGVFSQPPPSASLTPEAVESPSIIPTRG